MAEYLTFEEFRLAANNRTKFSFPTTHAWSESDWSTAIAGEVGEACNLIKKRRRGEKVPIQEVADELADAVVYITLLCSHLGVRLEDALVRKFNVVSDRVGSEYKLPIRDDCHD